MNETLSSRFSRCSKPLAFSFLLATASAGCTTIDYSRVNDVFTDATYSTYDDVIVIHNGRGGLVDPILAQYEQWANEGKTIIVDGQVISADAIGAFSENLLGQVCYTDRAIFSPHAAKLGTSPFNARISPEITEQLARRLIDPLEQRFRISPYFNDAVGYARIDAKELFEIWPEGKCSRELLEYTKRPRNIIR